MSKRNEQVLICDVCKKTETDGGELWIGGHPFSGWFAVQEFGGSTELSELKRKKDWHICGRKCLAILAANRKDSK